MKATRIRYAAWLASLATVILVCLAWQHDSENAASYLSRPSDVWVALKQWVTDPTLRGYIPVTLKEAALGFLLAVVVATIASLVLASSRLLSRVAQPFIAVLNAVPKIALAPVFLLLFGLGTESKVYFVAAGIVFIPFFALFQALTSVDPLYLNHVRVVGGRNYQIVRDVYIPAVIGSAVASLRVTASFALVAAIVTELIASDSGIGFEIVSAEQNSAPALLISGIIITGIIGFLVDRILLLAESRFSHWRIAR